MKMHPFQPILDCKRQPSTFEQLTDSGSIQAPLPYAIALKDVLSSIAATVRLIARRRLHSPRNNIGRCLTFADGTSGRVYRETSVDAPVNDPCVLVVAFRLRGVRGVGHAVFRAESLLNTPLFVGFPGFVSKLWLAHDQHGVYRGVYEWDDPKRAERYARSLWRVLSLVSTAGLIAYKVQPGMQQRDLFSIQVPGDDVPTGDTSAWWRITEVT